MSRFGTRLARGGTITTQTRFTGCSASASHGVWWFRIRGYGLILRAPWDRPLFSERYGHQNYLGACGWRVGVLRP